MIYDGPQKLCLPVCSVQLFRVNYSQSTGKHNANQPQIFDYPYIILIIGGLGSGKTNALPNLTKQQDGDNYNVIDKIYLYVKDPFETKYQYLINSIKNWY